MLKLILISGEITHPCTGELLGAAAMRTRYAHQQGVPGCGRVYTILYYFSSLSLVQQSQRSYLP